MLIIPVFYLLLPAGVNYYYDGKTLCKNKHISIIVDFID